MKIKYYFIIFFYCICLSSTPAFAQKPPPLLFKNVRVFDGQKIIESIDVMIQEGIIQKIEASISPPQNAKIIDGLGKTLLPGFIDSHVHLFKPIQLRQSAVLGVTTQLDMFTTPKSFNYLRKIVDSTIGQELSDFRTAGILATAPGGHGTEYGFKIPTINQADQADAFVLERLKEGSHYIKIVYDNYKTYQMSKPTIDKKTLKAIIQASHNNKKKAFVHIGSIQEAIDAIQAGADGLAHLSLENKISPEFVQIAARYKPAIIPTMTVLESMCGIKTGQSLLQEPFRSYLPPDAQKNLLKAFRTNPAPQGINCQTSMQYIKALHQSGVPLLIGSDAPNPGTTYGASVHRELELFVKAGISPLEALKSATSIPAEHFNLSDRGLIKEGYRADLLLIQGDPTKNIKHTRQISGVWKKGITINRKAYQTSFQKKIAPKIAPGLISNFKDQGASMSQWLPSTDQLLGGKSTVQLSWETEGSPTSKGSLKIKGHLTKSPPQPWAGSIYYPGKKPLAKANLANIKSLTFWIKGDGLTYHVLIFSGNEHQPPAIIPVSTTQQWQEKTINLTQLTGIYRQEVWGILFANRDYPGRFNFSIDHLEFK